MISSSNDRILSGEMLANDFKTSKSVPSLIFMWIDDTDTDTGVFWANSISIDGKNLHRDRMSPGSALTSAPGDEVGDDDGDVTLATAGRHILHPEKGPT